MKIGISITPKLILSSKNQKATIFFFFLKSKYKTSVFYHYTPQKIALITGVSINTVRKYIGWLRRNGYLDITNKNLWLKSTRKISPKEKFISIETLLFHTDPEYLPDYKPGRCFVSKRGITIHHGIKITVKY